MVLQEEKAGSRVTGKEWGGGMQVRTRKETWEKTYLMVLNVKTCVRGGACV